MQSKPWRVRRILGIVLFVMMAVLAWNWRPASPLVISRETTYITEPLDANGMPDYVAYLNQRMSEGVTPENNIETGLRPLLGTADLASQLNPDGVADLPFDPENPTFIPFREYLKRHPELSTFELQRTVDRVGYGSYPWHEDQKAAAAWIAEQTPILDAAVAVIASRDRYYLPFVRPDPQASLLDIPMNCPMLSELADALAARAMHSLALGDQKAAYLDAQACLKLGRLMSQPTSAIRFFQGCSVERRGHIIINRLATDWPLTRETAASIQTYLATLPPRPTIAELTDLSDRITFLDSAIAFQHGKHSQDIPRFLGNFDWNFIMEEGNLFFDRLVTAARNKDTAACEAIEQEVKRNAGFSLTYVLSRHRASEGVKRAFVDLFTPSTRSNLAGCDRREAEFLVTQTALALRAYHTTTGDWPATLEVLVPDYLPTVPTDPVTQKPLAYERTDDGWRLRPGDVDPKKRDAAGLSTDPYRGCRFPAPPMPGAVSP